MASYNLSRRGKRIFGPILKLTIANFAAFWTISILIGGDALNGYKKDGHYFLMSHGVITEVSKNIWYYSYYHYICVIFTFGLGIATLVLLKFTKDLVSRDASSR